MPAISIRVKESEGSVQRNEKRAELFVRMILFRKVARRSLRFADPVAALEPHTSHLTRYHVLSLGIVGTIESPPAL